MTNPRADTSLNVKISTVVAVLLHLQHANLEKLRSALQQKTQGMADYFDNEVAVLDVAEVSDALLPWSELVSLFGEFGLKVVAVRNAREMDHAAITSLGLSIDTMQPSRSIEETKPQPAPASAAVAVHVPAVVVDTPVRGGQRIYAKGADLIVTASVNAGAELIADGSIHIYSALRGRALAGASGNMQARIFTSSLQAELVSIAGIYRTFENGFPKLTPQQPVQIRLVGDSIEVSSVLSLG